MKNLATLKTVLTVIIFTASVGFTNAQNFSYDTKTGANGKVEMQTIYENHNNVLSPKMRHTYSYNADGTMSQKATEMWICNNWQPYIKLNYETEGQTTVITMDAWNSSCNKLVTKERYVYKTDNDNRLITSTNYTYNNGNWKANEILNTNNDMLAKTTTDSLNHSSNNASL